MGYIPLKKKLEKWQFLDQNHGLTPLKKCQFFEFLNFLFLSLERRFFVVEYRKKHFPGLYFLKKKSWKKAIFGPKPWANAFAKMPIFRLFELLVFKPRKAFFRFRISQKTFSWPILPKKKKKKKN